MLHIVVRDLVTDKLYKSSAERGHLLVVTQLGTDVRELGTELRELGSDVREGGTDVREQMSNVR